MKKVNHANLKFIPTWKLREILASPHCTGIDGADYEPVKEELQDILFEREAKIADNKIKNVQKLFEGSALWG